MLSNNLHPEDNMISIEHDNTLHITHLSDQAIHDLAPSFSKLPHTEHSDGQFRLRRYSVIQFLDDGIVNTGQQEFIQTEHYNHYQGGIKRHFEPILTETLKSDGMRELCDIFVAMNHLPNGQQIEIHQMRIETVFDETPVSPEGVHQDGFDCIAMIGIDRHNVVGGELMLYDHHDDAPFYRRILANGEIAMLADDRLWHNASPIRSIQKNNEGYMDVFVLTANRDISFYHS